MAETIDLTPLRLEAARLTGVATEFARIYGRQFTGTRADYASLTQDQQLRVSQRLGQLLQAQKAEEPARFTASQAQAIENLAKPPPPSPSMVSAFVDGAVEGLTNYPQTVVNVARGTVSAAGSVVGAGVQSATGGSLQSLLTKLLLGVALVGGGYVLLTSGVLRRK